VRWASRSVAALREQQVGGDGQAAAVQPEGAGGSCPGGVCTKGRLVKLLTAWHAGSAGSGGGGQ
jgi:hypothetical protein